MAYSESQKKAVKKYNEKAYDEIKVRVSKGRKEIIQAAADRNGESVNGLINRLIAAELERLGMGEPPEDGAVKVDPQQPDTETDAGGSYHIVSENGGSSAR